MRNVVCDDKICYLDKMEKTEGSGQLIGSGAPSGSAGLAPQGSDYLFSLNNSSIKIKKQRRKRSKPVKRTLTGGKRRRQNLTKKKLIKGGKARKVKRRKQVGGANIRRKRQSVTTKRSCKRRGS